MQFIELNTAEEVSALISSLPDTLALDTESTGLNPRVDQLKRVIISPDGVRAYSFSSEFTPLITPLQGAKMLYIQNFKHDYAFLYQYGIDLYNTPAIDPMLLHHLIDETQPHDLGFMVNQLYGDNYKELFWGKYKTYEEAPRAEALEYECKDAIYHYLVSEKLSNILDKDNRGPLIEHVHRLARALAITERDGILVDKELMARTKEEMGGKIATYLPKLRDDFNEYVQEWELTRWAEELDKRQTPRGKRGVPRPKFNFASGRQVQWLLYEKLGCPVLKKTDTGSPSTDYETIEKLEPEFPAIKPYKDYIELKTIYGTFVSGLLDRVEEGGRIYPSFNVNGTKTGRISHSNPNMGNMPTEGPYRNFFLPDPGCVVIGADFSQLEVVIEAHVTGDPNLKKIVLEGVSKHDITANALSIPRELAKTLNFAMGYHCGKGKVQRLLKCDWNTAEIQYRKYWETYRGCKQLKAFTDKKVECGDPITNMFGRIRHLPMQFEEPWMMDAAKRQAYNFMVQGPGADITNMALYEFSEWLKQEELGRTLFSVHDEIVASVKKEHSKLCIDKLKEIMDSLGTKVGLSLPLTCKTYGPFERWQKA